MDLAAAVVGFVSLGLQVSQNLITYYDGWRHSREDVDEICNSVGEMDQMLRILEDAIKRRSLNGCNETAFFENTLKRCEITMQRLDGKLKKVKDNTATGGFLARARCEWERVKYPLKESTILKLRDLLQEQKLDLVLILNALNVDGSSVKLETLTHNMSRLSCDISELGANVGATKNILKSSVQDLKRKEVLEWIYSQDQFSLHQSRESRRHPGTCQWFLQGREYQQWISAGSLLWVKGEVGCGKSFLCSAVIEHLQSYCATQSGNILLYFLFSFFHAHLQNPTRCLSSLLRQMCVNKRVFQDVAELYDRSNRHESAATRWLQHHEIELALDSAMAYLEGSKEIYIVFDALDELPNDSDEFQRSRVLDWIMKTSARYRHVHILFTSRSNSSSQDIQEFADRIPSIGTVTIDAMSNHDDMFSYLEAEFKKSRVLCKMPDHSLSKTFNEMIKMSDGMFQWLHLQMVELSKLPTLRIKDIDRILKSFPPSLDNTYAKILESIHYLLSSEAARALLWVSLSLRPLRLVEVNESCIIQPENTPVIEEQDRLEEEGILFCLAGLVRRTGTDDSYLALSHFSVKEFLMSETLRQTPCSSYGFHDDSAHALIAESCIVYIRHCYCSQNRTCTEKDLDSFPLLEYACRYWFEHMILAGKNNQVRLAPLASTFLQSGEEWDYATLIYNHMLTDTPFSCAHRQWTLRSPLGWATVLGLESVVHLLISQRSGDLNLIQDIRLDRRSCFKVEKPCKMCRMVWTYGRISGTALMKAVEFGHKSIVKLLIENGADINSSGESDQTALSLACGRGKNDHLVKYLLDNGARPSSNALSQAVFGGTPLICELLLAAGAETDDEGEEGVPLILAAHNGYNDICQLLLDFGADINHLIKMEDSSWRDRTVPTDALTAATMSGNVQTVELLLSHGALIRGSALAYSLTGVENGVLDSHREICNILIQHGADMNPDLGGFYNTPLAMALHNDWWDVANFMISKGARVEPNDPTCVLAGNILVKAIRSVEMTSKILGMGVAADSPIAAIDAWFYEDDGPSAGTFTTALQAATYYRHFDTVNLLLENGANPNMLGPPYGSPMFSLFAGACSSIENIWPAPGGEPEKEAYLKITHQTAQIYFRLWQQGANFFVPFGSLDYSAFCECMRGIEYSSIETGLDVINSIDEESFCAISIRILEQALDRLRNEASRQNDAVL